MASWRHEPARVAGAWSCFRQVSPEWPPLWHDAGEPRPSQESARWHRQGESYAQYLSLSAQGAWAELVRYEGIRDAAYASAQRRTLWQVFVRDDGIADLSDFDRWATCGLDPRDAVAEHEAAQQLGDELRAAGYRGVLAPSAALPGATNLTLFGVRYEAVMAYDLERWSNPDADVWLPCTLVAEAAAPPAELVVKTCFLNAPHAAYRTYLASIGQAPPPGAP